MPRARNCGIHSTCAWELLSVHEGIWPSERTEMWPVGYLRLLMQRRWYTLNVYEAFCEPLTAGSLQLRAMLGLKCWNDATASCQCKIVTIHAPCRRNRNTRQSCREIAQCTYAWETRITTASIYTSPPSSITTYSALRRHFTLFRVCNALAWSRQTSADTDSGTSTAPIHLQQYQNSTSQRQLQTPPGSTRQQHTARHAHQGRLAPRRPRSPGEFQRPICETASSPAALPRVCCTASRGR